MLWEGPARREFLRGAQRVRYVPLTKLDGSAVTLLKWMSAQSGKVPSWKMVCAQVFMAKLSSRTPIRFIRSPVRTCKGAQGEGGFYSRPIIQMGNLRVRKSFTQDGTAGERWRGNTNPGRLIPNRLPSLHALG